MICAVPVIGGRDALLARRAEIDGGIVTVGDNAARSKIAAWLLAEGFRLVNALHPAATLARRLSIGNGTVIMAGAVVNSDTCLGANVIINTGATVDHDCVIGDNVHIAPGCTLSGNVSVGDVNVSGELRLMSNTNPLTTPDLRVNTGGKLTGSGSISGDVMIGNGGTLSPGASPGVQNVAGNLTIAGAFIAEIDGLAPAQFDREIGRAHV